MLSASTLPSYYSDWTNTTKSCRRTRAIGFDHRLHARVRAQNARHSGSKEENNVPSFDIPQMCEETTDPSLQAMVVPNRLTCSRIKALAIFGTNSVMLYLYAQHEERRKCVSKLQNAQRGYEARKRTDKVSEGIVSVIIVGSLPELRNGSSQHKGNAPIHRDNSSPE